MDHAAVVGVLDAVEDLAGQDQGAARRQRPAPDDRRQRLAAHQLEHQVEAASLDHALDGADDVLVLQQLQRVALTGQPPHRLAVVLEIGQRRLHGAALAVGRLDLVDRAHRAAAEDVADDVAVGHAMADREQLGSHRVNGTRTR